MQSPQTQDYPKNQSNFNVRGFSLILDSIEVEIELPYEISSRIRVNRASPEQLLKIKSKLTALLNGMHRGWEEFYQSTAFKQSSENSCSWQPDELPKEKWRYYIIETDCSDIGELLNLQNASSISLMPIKITSLAFISNNMQHFTSSILNNHFFGNPMPQPKSIGFSELKDLTEAYQQYMQITGGWCNKGQYPEIQRAIQMLENLNHLPANSEFHVLGMFAIIEMLITHNPKLEDRGDSITHQMQSKIPLLANRFKHKISPQSFFGNTADKKIWNALYKYRSTVAHGGIADFSNSNLQLLKSENIARSFLLDVVRKMVRHAFSEPELYRDLREC